MSVQTLSLPAGTGVLTSPVILLPHNVTNFYGYGSIGCLMNFSGNGVGYGGVAATGNVTLQLSNDPNANPSNAANIQATARWNNHDTLVNRTTDQNSSIVYPCRYARLIGTVTIGTVTCHVSIADSSNPGG